MLKASLLRAPPFWRRITPDQGLISYRQKHEWTLVLSARGIPYFLGRAGRRQHLFVPPLLEEAGRNELNAYIKENRPRKTILRTWPLYKNWAIAPFYVFLLAFIYIIQKGYLTLSGLPTAQLASLGSLDSIRVILHGEWSRLVTALTLHTGWPHLIGNMFFGAFFIALLSRLCGYGHALLLTCLSGIGGNLISLFVHKLGYASVGFSTAVFGALGALVGILLWRTSERIYTPFAAGLAFLAMLGVEGANTDYGAHLCGLFTGCVLGIGEGFCLGRGWKLLPQFLAALLALLIPLMAWGARLGLIQ